MKTMHRSALSLAATLILGVSLTAWAQDTTEIKTDIDLETLSCRTMLKMDNDDREFTLVFFHGLISGRQGEMVFRGEALAEATDRILDQCIDAPNEALLKVFEKARKS